MDTAMTVAVDAPSLAPVNELTGTMIAVALIATGIGVITTIVGVVLLKSGVIPQSKFEPWKIVTALWGTVLLVSLPALVHFGSTLFPAPPMTNAQAVTPAYENFEKAEVINNTDTFLTAKSEEEMKAVLGSQAENYDHIFNYDDVTLHYWPSADDESKADVCYEMILDWGDLVGGGNGEYRTGKEHITPDGFSEEACGGPLKTLPES